MKQTFKSSVWGKGIERKYLSGMGRNCCRLPVLCDLEHTETEAASGEYKEHNVQSKLNNIGGNQREIFFFSPSVHLRNMEMGKMYAFLFLPEINMCM